MNLADLTELPLPMPPMLADVVGVQSEKQFFSLSYEGSKPFWSDGRAGATFSFYGAYQPFIEHLAVAIHLFAFHLGSDDEPPTHALLVDRQESRLYVGTYNQVMQTLKAQHPPRRPPTPEELAEIEAHLAALEHLSFEDFRQQGMFDFLLGPTPQQKDKCWAMIAWLDELITADLIQAYQAASQAGNQQALYHLLLLGQRIEATPAIPTESSPLH